MTQMIDRMNKLETIFRDELDDDTIRLAPELTPNEIEAWDSLAHVRIISAVEREFGVEFDITEIENIQSVQDILNVIAG